MIWKDRRLAWSGPMLALCLLLAPAAGAAQEKADLVSPILTLDQESLFAGSRYGQAIKARLEAEAAALQEESRRIDAALEAEERALTDQRATMNPAEFRRLADAFDTRVEDLRAAQDAKSRDLTRRREDGQQTFFQAAVPVLGEMLRERGAVAIVDKKVLILSFDRIDVTEAAIARIDAVLGDGLAPVPGDQVPPPPADAGEPVEPPLVAPPAVVPAP